LPSELLSLVAIGSSVCSLFFPSPQKSMLDLAEHLDVAMPRRARMAQYGCFSASSCKHLTRTVRCPEYIRLRQHYEAALRHWGHVLFFPNAALVDTEAQKAAELKQKTFDERNAAKERLSAHKLSCTACNPKLKRIDRSAN
jgi:hypothetical protein